MGRLAGGLLAGAALASWLGAAAGLPGFHRALVKVERSWMLGRLPAYYVEDQYAFPRGPLVQVHHSGERAVADATARLIARHLLAVTADLGLADGAVAQPIPVVIVPSGDAMVRFLGRRYGDNSVGAYWRGVIWILSPAAWMDASGPGWERRYEVEGPVVHELTHLLLDRASGGRVSPWLDEGLAQWAEYRATGFQWAEGAVGPGREPYPLNDLLTRFHELADQARAYRQAFLLVRFLDERYGAEAPAALVRAVAEGRTEAEAIRSLTGRSLAALEREWLAWMRVEEGLAPPSHE